MDRFYFVMVFAIAIGFWGCSENSTTNQIPDLHVPEGYVIERVAGPELLDYPMFASFDDRGRLFVYESTGNVYERTQDALDDPKFRIKLLEDTDNDGTFDKATIFADKLSFPQGGVFHQGSLIASSAPDLLKLTDTDGDGVADMREVLLSGWVLNVNANSLIGPFMGPDGWLYFTSAIEGFDVTTKEGERMAGETARMWRVRPNGTELEWVGAGGMNNPVELTFTDAGEVLGTQTFYVDPQRGLRDAILFWMKGGVYGKRNSNITRDGLPLTGDLLPVVSEYSRVAPSGIATYRNTTLGADFMDNMFTAQFNTHSVLRHSITREGASFKLDDEKFLWTDNGDFHPTDVLEDGDGSLLIVETGGWFIKGCPLSQVSKPQLKGSIYRITKKGAPKIADKYGNDIEWETISSDKMTGYLADSRPLVADRALTSIVERGEGVIETLSAVLKNNSSEDARTKAVFALYRIGTDQALKAARSSLDDENVQVKVAGARVLGLAKDGESVPKLIPLVQSADPAVKRQSATALGQIGDVSTIPSLLDAAANTEDRFVRHAITYSLITMNQPEMVVQGLNHSSTAVKEIAMIALDQMEGSPIRSSQVIPVLSGEDQRLKKTALWVASHHSEWSGDMINYIGKRLSSDLSDQEKQVLSDVLVGFCGNETMQNFMVGQLKTASVPGKIFIMDNMARCNVKQFPSKWINQLGSELSSKDPNIRSKSIELVRLRSLTSLNDKIEKIATNTNEQIGNRIDAVAFLVGNEAISDSWFDFLLEILNGDYESPVRQKAASILAQADLSESQLVNPHYS